MSDEEEKVGTEASAAATPEDANDLRGFHFKRLMARSGPGG